MKHTFTDSEPTQRPEHRGRKLFKRGTALASLALVSASFMHSPEEVDVHAIPVPGRVLRDSNGDVVPAIPPERTITLASTSGQSEAFYPNYVESNESQPGYCQVVDMQLPQRIDYNEVVKGSKTEFALSTEQYQQLQGKIEQAESISEVQHILASAMTDLGITARFDVPLSPPYQPYEKAPAGSDSLDTYISGVNIFLGALSGMPRQMVMGPESINFVNVRQFTKVNDKGEIFNAGGLWASGKKEITLPMLGLSQHNVVHEFAHAMHSKACEGVSDEELKGEFDAIMDYLHSNPRMKYLEEKFWKKSRTPDDEGVYLEYLRQGKLTGLPTSYSRTSHVELLAELTASMVCEDGLFGDARARAEETKDARRVREMVLERLKAAMPDVDVNGWLEYIQNYKLTQPAVLDPEHAIADRVSPLDSTYAYYNYVYKHAGELVADWKLTPAVMIKGHNGTPDQYIYAYENLKKGEIDIQMSVPQGADETKELLVEAATRFIRSTPGYENKKIETIDFDTMTGRSNSGVELIVFGNN